MKHIIPVKQSNSAGLTRLAATAEISAGYLMAGFTSLQPDEVPVDSALKGEGVEAVSGHPRPGDAPHIKFADELYPRIASAFRVVHCLVEATIGEGRVRYAIEPIEGEQGKSRLTMDGVQSLEIVKADGHSHIFNPGELALAGMVATYNAMQEEGVTQVPGFMMPQAIAVNLG